EDGRYEAVVERAQPLHELAGRWLDRDDLHRGVALLQISADAHECAARAETGDEDVDLRTVAPDLGAGAFVLGERVRRVAVLEQQAQRRVVGRELLGETDRAVAPLLAGRRHDLGTEDLEEL